MASKWTGREVSSKVPPVNDVPTWKSIGKAVALAVAIDFPAARIERIDALVQRREFHADRSQVTVTSLKLVHEFCAGGINCREE